MIGYVGDWRVLPMAEPANTSVPFGETGGVCGLDGVDERCERVASSDAPAPSTADEYGINCLYGCLFNVTIDVTESDNLINKTEYADALGHMQARLAAAGQLAPPWFQAPEVDNYTDAELGQALCDAARRSGNVQPIDF